jgi:hypothetical protein
VGGSVLIYVWALEQEKKFGEPGEQDVLVSWHNQFKYDKKLKSEKLDKESHAVNNQKKTGKKKWKRINEKCCIKDIIIYSRKENWKRWWKRLMAEET